MNKFNKKSIFAIIVLVLVLAISIVLPLGTVFADYIDVVTDSSAVINFNQLISNTYNHNSTLPYGINLHLVDNTFVGDKIYIKIDLNVSAQHFYFEFKDASDNVTLNVVDYTTYSGIFEDVVTIPSNSNYLNFWSNNNISCNNLIYINLSQMFGYGNEPNLQQAKKIFVSDFYSYTSGVPVSYVSLQAYTDGLNAYASSTQLQISTSSFINSVYASNLNNTYIGYGVTQGVSWSVLTKDTNYVTLDGTIVSNGIGTICLPFNYVLEKGTQISISGYCSTTQYNNNVSVGVGIYNNGMIEVANFTARTQGYYMYNSTTFTLPVDTDRIYIYCDENVNLRDFQVGYYVTDLELLKSNSYDAGFADAKKIYDAYYAQGGVGYQAIYNTGYYAYPTDDHFTFEKLIYSVIDVPVQAFTNLFDYDILGVNMKTFYLSLFTLAVIVTIIRLVL